MTTSSGNTILTECLNAYVLSKEFNSDAQHEDCVPPSDADFVVEGDDNALGYTSQNPRRTLKSLLHRLQLLGFDMTVESYGEPEQGVVFCKMHFVQYKGRIVAYKDIRHALLKLGWADTPRKCGSYQSQKYFLGKVNSLLASYNYWPRLCKVMEHWTGATLDRIKQQHYYRNEFALSVGTNAAYEELDEIMGEEVD